MKRGVSFHTRSTSVDAPQAGEIALLGAILRQAVDDARGIRRANDSVSALHRIQAEAQAFLRDTTQLMEIVELMDADVTRVQPALLRAAGIDGRRGHEA